MGNLSRAVYRIRQFSDALHATVDSDETGLVRSVLTETEQDLFFRMPLADQRHSLDVFYSLVSRGHMERPLLKAALLHDVGKTANHRSIGVITRSLAVLANALSPRLTSLLSSSKESSWRYGFFLHRTHERRSAEMLQRAGTDEATITLVENHEHGAGSPLAKLLRQADEAN
ncbi:MAG: HDIG domain-containing protein [Chloroflexi bacterium]|nr:HDIG domain-containing protein [Chloroflexota bacterium]